MVKTLHQQISSGKACSDGCSPDVSSSDGENASVSTYASGNSLRSLQLPSCASPAPVALAPVRAERPAEGAADHLAHLMALDFLAAEARAQAQAQAGPQPQSQQPLGVLAPSPKRPPSLAFVPVAYVPQYAPFDRNGMQVGARSSAGRVRPAPLITKNLDRRAKAQGYKRLARKLPKLLNPFKFSLAALDDSESAPEASDPGTPRFGAKCADR